MQSVQKTKQSSVHLFYNIWFCVFKFIIEFCQNIFSYVAELFLQTFCKILDD